MAALLFGKTGICLVKLQSLRIKQVLQLFVLEFKPFKTCQVVFLDRFHLLKIVGL